MEFSFCLLIVAVLMKRIKSRSYIPAIVWAILIMAVSSIPNLSTPNFRFSFADKIAHFVEYFILGLLTTNAARGFVEKTRTAFLISAILASAYGVLDELHQMLIPGRSVEVLDMASNVTGAVFGSFIIARFFRKPSSPAV